jgi:hypothetical protein
MVSYITVCNHKVKYTPGDFRSLSIQLPTQTYLILCVTGNDVILVRI